jgi:glycerate kinase
MHALLAFDKFKGALTAHEACVLTAAAIGTGQPDWCCDVCPLTDGGEGFADILTRAVGGSVHQVRVSGPTGNPVTAKYGLVRLNKIPAAARALLDLGSLPATAKIAVVEMAQASGLALLPDKMRDPWQATTYGTGQVIRSAIRAGARAVLLGIGGSATHDLGLGALSALGVKFRRLDGGIVQPPAPVRWAEIGRISRTARPWVTPIRIACDVTNPLLGPHGAAKIYGPQKGLRARDYARLEKVSAQMASFMCEHFGRPATLCDIPGTGAAGGISFGLICALNAGLLPGFDLVYAWLDVAARLAAADIVITGEGRFDRSSFNGKGPGSLVKRAVELGLPVHVFTGKAVEVPRHRGLQVHVITPRGQRLSGALREAGPNLTRAALNTFTAPRYTAPKTLP